MKLILIKLLIVLITIISCENSSSLSEQEKILGRWKLIETYGSNGANGQWSQIADGYYYQFYKNMSVESDDYSCLGNYMINNQDINLSFDCSSEYFNATFEFSFDNNNLILWNGTECDEGCGYKFEKLY